MIINIPLQIDEARMEEVLQRDYEGKVLDRIEEYIKKSLSEKSRRYYGDKVADGMNVLIEERIDIFLYTRADEIIQRASEMMAAKLARSKRGKAILEEVANGSD